MIESAPTESTTTESATTESPTTVSNDGVYNDRVSNDRVRSDKDVAPSTSRTSLHNKNHPTNSKMHQKSNQNRMFLAKKTKPPASILRPFAGTAVCATHGAFG